MLETLSLDDNEISGTIPDTLNQVRSLGKISFRKNFLSSSIPDNLGDLLSYNLEYLDLSNNQLSGAIPAFIDSPPAYFFANLSNNLFTCPIPSWALYTDANCIQWDVTAIDPLCNVPNEDINIYGNNFLQMDGLLCAFYNFTTNMQMGTSPAQVISDNHILCKSNHTFIKCNGDPGYETFIDVNLKLTLNGQVISGNETIHFGMINYRCNFAEVDRNFIIPSFVQVLSFCPSGNPSPYSCPSDFPSGPSSRYIPAIINTGCSDSNSNTTCYWAEPYDPSHGLSCPYYYCPGSGNPCTQKTFCPASNACYSTSSDCSSNSVCNQ